MSVAGTYRAPFTVRIADAGSTRRATMPAVCGWLQEAAATHARDLGFSIQRMHEFGVAWVLARLAVRMDAYPPVGDRVTVETWPAALERVRAVRDFRIYDAAGTQLGAATSVWVALDVARRRAVAMPPFVTECHPASSERALELTGKTLPAPAPGATPCHILTRAADVDENGHVNNVRLLEWALEPTPEPLLREHPLLVDIAFRAECRHPAAVTAGCASEGDGPGLLHGVFAADGAELVRMRSLWPPR